ncbi:hypothetical protein NLG97_g9854 [Lecanicillium saksenae]|uniref:Uncharacterized protein n=1 Tax=Lecanicillium saksenae TaxID=468837 RepID=A0ACC1QFD1_9HYPO|nr:hypothetical protein NLG97_g9854 [Lecanicillium saksenae]
MLSSRLQRRLQSIRCVYSLARQQAVAAAAARPTQRRLASSAPRPPPASRSSPKPASSAVRQTPAANNASAAAAATRARLNAEKGAPPVETAEEYQARYKSAARRWTSTIIALPILLVTSYYLFDRLALGNAQKELNRESMRRDD